MRKRKKYKQHPFLTPTQADIVRRMAFELYDMLDEIAAEMNMVKGIRRKSLWRRLYFLMGVIQDGKP